MKGKSMLKFLIGDRDFLKLDNGVYEFGGCLRVLVDGGVVYLPHRLASPGELMRSRTLLRAAEYPAGVLDVFIRAKDLIALRPELEAMVRSLAARVGCDV